MPRFARTSSNSWFVNPYHFVPLENTPPKRVDIADVLGQKGLLTGWIECELTTKTPLVVPNSSNPDIWLKRGGKDTIKSYDFASYEDLSGKSGANPAAAPADPIIPGSELRGVIRTAYEAVTNSCMSIIDDDKVLYKRIATIRTAGGLVKNQDGTYELYTNCTRSEIRAREWRTLEAQYGDKEGQYVTIGSNSGWLHIGDYNPVKKNARFCVSLLTGGSSNPVTLPQKAVDNYFASLKIYRDDRLNQHHVKNGGKHSGYKHVHLDADSFAVFYAVDNAGRYYLSPAQMGRDVFFNRIADLIKNSGHTPCTDTAHVCPACSLFGFVTEKRSDTEALSGRVRFSDARLTPVFAGQNNFLAPRPLPELASPKPSATEFYLMPEKRADTWNYDYAVLWTGSKRGSSTFKTLSGYKPRIRGRKFFWHDLSKESMQGKTIGEGLATKRHVFVRPLKPEVTFAFKVHFDRISESELRTLLWTLTIGGDAKEHGHKIGMGKPVGYGSAVITVNDVKVRTIRPDDFYAVDSRPDLMENIADAVKETPAVKAFKTITQLRPSFSVQNIPVSYPLLEGSTDKVYEWFVANKEAEGRKTHEPISSKNRMTGKIESYCRQSTSTMPVIDQPLPEIDAPQLQRLSRVGGSSGRSQGGQGRPYQGGGGNRSQGDYRRQGKSGGDRQYGSSGPRTLSDAERGKRGKDKNDGGYSDRYTWSHR